MPDGTTVHAPPRGMVKEKRLINSFILANLCDVVLTGIALQIPGFIEKGIVAGEMLAQARIFELLILKTAVTAFIIGTYALAAHRKSRYSHSIEVALRIGTLVVWCAVAWNELNIAVALSAIL